MWSNLPEEMRQLGADRMNLIVNDIRNMDSGNIVSHESDPAIHAAADRHRNLLDISQAAMTVVGLSLAVGGGGPSSWPVFGPVCARNGVEGIITLFLSACTSVAILTTVGIALSVLFESIRFFQAVPVADFLFGLEWSPQTAIREEQGTHPVPSGRSPCSWAPC